MALAGLAMAAGLFAAVITAPDLFEREWLGKLFELAHDLALIPLGRIAVNLDLIGGRKLESARRAVQKIDGVVRKRRRLFAVKTHDDTSSAFSLRPGRGHIDQD